MPKKHTGVFKDTKRGTWYVSTTTVLPNGVKVAITKRGYLTEKDAFLDIDNLKQAKIAEYNKNITFIDWADTCDGYWNYYSKKVKKTTANNHYKCYAKHIITPYIGKSVSDVCSRVNLINFKNNIEDLDCKVKHKNAIIHYMKETVDFAYQRGLLGIEEFKLANIELENFYEGNEIKEEKKIWSKEEFRRFIDTFDDNDKYKVLFELFGHLGCRISELRGLQVKHFDREKKSIFICQQANSKMGSGTWELVPPKTKKSVRHISLSDKVNNMLAEYIDIMGYKSDDFIFFGDSPVGETSIRRAMDKHIAMSGVTKISPHAIRHSNTTWLLSDPNLTITEISKISARLGHSSRNMTLNTYFHLTDDDLTKVLQNLD